MRPMYEKEENLEVEREAASIIEAKWNCTVNKMPIRYYLDFVLCRGDQAFAFCEIKTRNRTMLDVHTLGGYLIDISKWTAAKNLCEASNLPFILVVKMIDGVYYAKVDDFKPDGVLVRGRKDRGDWQDVGPCAVLNTSRFKRLQ